MPRRNRNVERSNRKRIKHCSRSPRTEKKYRRSRRFVIEKETGLPTIAWQPGKFNHGSRRRAA